MTQFDSKLEQPRRTDDTSSELSHASDEIFNEWTKDIRKSFASAYDMSEKFADNTSAFMTCAFGSESALAHSKEIERCASAAKVNGDNVGAKHFLKRDLAYSMWTLGYNNAQTQSLKSQLDQLENPFQTHAQNPAQQSVVSTGGINSFAKLFKAM